MTFASAKEYFSQRAAVERDACVAAQDACLAYAHHELAGIYQELSYKAEALEQQFRDEAGSNDWESEGGATAAVRGARRAGE